MISPAATEAIWVSEEQSRKAQLPMLVRLAGSWIDVNEESGTEHLRFFPFLGCFVGPSCDSSIQSLVNTCCYTQAQRPCYAHLGVTQ